MKLTPELLAFLAECKEEEEVWNFVGLLLVMIVSFVIVPLVVN